MHATDSRRLMGPNLLLPVPAAVIDVALDPSDDAGAVIAAWERGVRSLAADVAIPVGGVADRVHASGASMAFAAPIDRLLAATDVNDAVIEELAGGDLRESRKAEIRRAAQETANPRLLALQDDAAAAGLMFLWDDELVSFGAGIGTASFARDRLPDALPRAHNVPVGLITGTNGKTTSARLVARILRLAGTVAGCATTDAVAIGERVIDRGDYTGPDAARRVLRDPRVEVAVLETARGGILRRGLAVPWADAALLTNVSADHLGLYGVDDVATMARVKGVAGAAVRAGGTVVVNVDDPSLVDLAGGFVGEVVTFSLGAVATWRVHEGWFVREGTRLLRGDDVPITFGGAAPYNAANALGAAALAEALGADRDAIVEGLRTFRSSEVDNPGRGNIVQVGDRRVLLDFGHNPEAVRAVLALARQLRGQGRLVVATGQPGDRRDDAIRAVGAEIAAAGAARVFLYDLSGYERGRAPGEVPKLLAAAVGDVPHELAASEVAAVTQALRWARSGDLIVVMPHLERDAVRAVLDGFVIG
jgi:cyanophycin synthetase